MFQCRCPREVRGIAVFCALLIISPDALADTRLPLSPGNPSQSVRPPCKKPCALHATCSNCTSQGMECMWCGSRQRCVDSSAYVISFPYGQCLEWQTSECLGKTRGWWWWWWGEGGAFDREAAEVVDGVWWCRGRRWWRCW